MGLARAQGYGAQDQKNYYIKNANQVADGKYVPEWYHNNKLEQVNCKTTNELDLEEEVKILKEYIDRVQTTVNNG